MTEKQKNDVLYVCSLIETIARKTKNHRQDVIRHFTKAGIERQLRLAEVNHCLSFEQVSDELIEDLNIPDGDFDTAAECRYTVPSATSIGMLYQGLVLSTMKDEDAAQAILDVFSSFITDAEAYTAEKEAAAQAAQERKQAEEDAKKAAEEAEASGSEQTGGNKVTKYAATFLGVLALVGLVAGGGIYTFMKQKQKKQAEKEALDPDANYTEDKGDFEIPVEDEPEETGEEDTEPI